jgi:RNA polymerase sigma-70 factor (ECF subfamily)
MSVSVLQTVRDLFAPADEQLMWRVQAQDDAAAFGTLVGRWQAPIQRLCTRLTGDEHRAEDLTQEVFARLFAHRKSYQADRKFATYLWRIALNHCYRDLGRARHRFERPLPPAGHGERPVTELLADHQPAPDEALADAETAATVRRALAALPEHLRTILVLRHYENLKFREIADVLEIPEGTVKTRMTEALRQLAGRLGRALECQAGPSTRPRLQSNECLVL